MENERVLLTGIKPTGRPHVGNYFGAMKQLVDLQSEYSVYAFIANYHALTSTPDKKTLQEDSLNVALDYVAVGLDPQKVTLFMQSDVPEVAELAWIFNCLTSMSFLERGHAYKDAQAKNEDINVGTFDYPMLMAADILIQDASVVPVGKDQKQHIEMARDIAEKFNHTYTETFVLPEPLIKDGVAIVPGTDGQKMSKSYGNTIPLFGTDEEIKKAVMGIVTDSSAPEDSKNPEEDSVFALHKLFSADQLNDLEKRYREGGIGHQESKELLAEHIISFIAPKRQKREELEQNKDDVLQILENGGEAARSRARAKMKLVKDATGLNFE